MVEISPYVPDFILIDKYAFVAAGISNGFKTKLFYVNMEDGTFEKLYSFNEPSIVVRAILPVGVQNNRLYFINGLDESVGRELFYIDLNLQITAIIDFDGDGFDSSIDCDDNNAAVNPSQTEIPYNGIDDDCNDATLDDDLDQDGFLGIDDCNDQDPTVYPGAPEILDNDIDEDCDGSDLSPVFELNESKIDIFPNPATDFVQIQIQGNLEYKVTMFDITGKVLFTKVNTNQIDVRAFAEGIYYLEILDLDSLQKVTTTLITTKQ